MESSVSASTFYRMTQKKKKKRNVYCFPLNSVCWKQDRRGSERVPKAQQVAYGELFMYKQKAPCGLGKLWKKTDIMYIVTVHSRAEVSAHTNKWLLYKESSKRNTKIPKLISIFLTVERQSTLSFKKERRKREELLKCGVVHLKKFLKNLIQTIHTMSKQLKDNWYETTWI